MAFIRISKERANLFLGAFFWCHKTEPPDVDTQYMCVIAYSSLRLYCTAYPLLVLSSYIQVKDLVRGSIECQTHKHLEATYRLLAAKLDVVVLKDRRSKPQRDLLVVFDVAGELLVEVQVRFNYGCIHRHVQSV